MLEEKELARLRKNNRTKGIIGFLLLVTIIYFLASNFSEWTKSGYVIEGPSQTCTEIRGPEVLQDTETRQLDVSDEGFEAIKDQDRAVIRVINKDDVPGEVRVRLYCDGGDEQGDVAKELNPGETGLFLFEDVADCDLEYIVEPELLTFRTERRADIHDIKCG